MSLVEKFSFEFSETVVWENLCIRSKQKGRERRRDENTGICEENVQWHFPCHGIAKGILRAKLQRILRAELQRIQFLFVHAAVI